jgi:hypothetical protein
MSNTALLHQGEEDSSSGSESEPSLDNIDEAKLRQSLYPARKRKKPTKSKMPALKTSHRSLNKNRSAPVILPPLVQLSPQTEEEKKDAPSPPPAPDPSNSPTKSSHPLASSDLYKSVESVKSLARRMSGRVKVGVRTWFHKGKKVHDQS